MPWGVRVGLMAVSLAFVAVIVAAAMTNRGDAAAYGVLTVVGVLLPLVIALVHSRIAVDDSQLVLSLWPVWTKRIPVTDVADATEVVVSPVRDFGGVGLRFAGQGRIALLMRRGPAVAVQTASGRTYVLGTADPDGLIEALGVSSVR